MTGKYNEYNGISVAVRLTAFLEAKIEALTTYRSNTKYSRLDELFCLFEAKRICEVLIEEYQLNGWSDNCEKWIGEWRVKLEQIEEQINAM
jgi:hypothetical protein